jgi:hypothetical protein
MKSARVGAKLSNMRISRKWAVAWAQDVVLAKLDGVVRVDGDVCSRGRMVDGQHRQGVRDRQIGIQVTGMDIRVSEFIEQQRACIAQKIDARSFAAHPRSRDRMIQLVEDRR